MKKHFKKRLAAFKVGLVLSIMITPFCFYKIAEPVKADVNNVITYNSYGSTERGKVTVTYNGSTYITDGWIRFNFNGQYNGIIGIYLSGASPLSNFAVAVDNCHIISTSTNYIQIEFYGVNQCEVHFNSATATMGTFNINSVSWDSMTFLGHSDSAELINIENRLNDLKAYTDSLETLMATNNTLLTTIQSNTSVAQGSTINNINVDLRYIKQNQDSIWGALADFLTDAAGQVISLSTLIDHIDRVTTATQANTAKLTDIYNLLSDINTTLTSIDTNLQNIDNTIDTITWRSGAVYKGISTDLINFTVPDAITTLSANQFITWGYFNFNAAIMALNPIFKLTIPVNANQLSYDLIISNTSGSQTTRTASIIYEDKSRSNLTVYFMQKDPYTNWAQSNVSIKVNGSTQLYVNYTPTMQFIGNDDIEYWELLSYFNENKLLNQELERLQSIDNKLTNINSGINSAADRIVNAINGIIINPSDVTSEDVEEVINNYDYNFELINNVETDLSDLFDRNIDGFQDMIDNNYRPLTTTLQQGTTFLNSIFVHLTELNLFKAWFYLALIGLVLFVLLG